MKRCVYFFIVLILGSLTACRTDAILRSAAQETAFKTRFIGKPFYTAMVLRPYEVDGEYLVDLTGKMAEAAYELSRAEATIPLGTPITVTALERKHILARVEGYTQAFRILVDTEMGILDELAKDLTLLLSPGPPLRSVRASARPFVKRQEMARGMSRREVYMSWGQPDKITESPSSSGFLEEWIYFDRRTHLFLENGFVTNWQQF